MWQHERWECTAASGESKSRSLHHAAWTLSLSRCYLLRSSKWPSQIAWQTYTLYCTHEYRVSKRRQSNEYIFVYEHFYFKLLLITRQWINNKLKCIIATLIYEYTLNLVLFFFFLLLTDNHLVNTKCSTGHYDQALCCKMSAELDKFLEYEKK